MTAISIINMKYQWDTPLSTTDIKYFIIYKLWIICEIFIPLCSLSNNLWILLMVVRNSLIPSCRNSSILAKARQANAYMQLK